MRCSIWTLVFTLLFIASHCWSEDGSVIINNPEIHIILLPGSAINFTFNSQLPELNGVFHTLEINKSCGCTAVSLPKESAITGGRLPISVLLHGDVTPDIRHIGVQITGTYNGTLIKIRQTIVSTVQDIVTRDEETWKTVDLGKTAHEKITDTIQFKTGPNNTVPWDTVSTRINGSGGIWAATTVYAHNYITTTVTFSPQVLVGQFSGAIEYTFAKGGVELPYKPILPLLVTVPGCIRAYPSSVLIGAIRVNETNNYHVDIENDGTGSITGIIGSSKRVGGRLETDPYNKGISITVNGSPPLGPLNEYIDVTLNDANKSVLRIPCVGTVILGR